MTSEGRTPSSKPPVEVNGCRHEDSDGTPCTRREHNGDHENFYANRRWT